MTIKGNPYCDALEKMANQVDKEGAARQITIPSDSLVERSFKKLQDTTWKPTYNLGNEALNYVKKNGIVDVQEYFWKKIQTQYRAWEGLDDLAWQARSEGNELLAEDIETLATEKAWTALGKQPPQKIEKMFMLDQPSNYFEKADQINTYWKEKITGETPTTQTTTKKQTITTNEAKEKLKEKKTYTSRSQIPDDSPPPIRPP